MHLGIGGDVLFTERDFFGTNRLNALQAHEIGDEFCKLRGIQNASIPRCMLYFLQYMHEHRVFLSI